MTFRMILSRKTRLFAFVLAALFPAAVLAQAPIDSWSFDETSGTIAHNSIPGRADGILTSGAVFVPGINGNAVYLPPFASVNFASPTGNLGTSDFSISFWLKTTGDGIGNVSAAFCELLGNRGAEGSADTPYIDFRMGRTGFLTLEVTGFGGSGYTAAATDASAGPVNDGNWHFISGVRQGTQIQIYIDGALRATATGDTVADIQSLYDFAAGANANTSIYDIPFNGTIDGLKIYNRAFSNVEILIALSEELLGNMVAGGTLAANNAKPLITKLEGVLNKYDGAQTGAACNQLGAYINQINAYIRSRTLTPAQGQVLIDVAQQIQVAIPCPGAVTCPCWDPAELTSITAANQATPPTAPSCFSNPAVPALIQNIPGSTPGVEGGFAVFAAGGGSYICSTRDLPPFELPVTPAQQAVCEQQIRNRCQAIGTPIP